MLGSDREVPHIGLLPVPPAEPRDSAFQRTAAAARGPLDSSDSDGEWSPPAVPPRPVPPFYRTTSSQISRENVIAGGLGDDQTIASFCPVSLHIHMQAYRSSSDSENETEKIRDCEAYRASASPKFPSCLDADSENSSVFGGDMCMIQSGEGRVLALLLNRRSRMFCSHSHRRVNQCQCPCLVFRGRRSLHCPPPVIYAH